MLNLFLMRLVNQISVVLNRMINKQSNSVLFQFLLSYMANLRRNDFQRYSMMQGLDCVGIQSIGVRNKILALICNVKHIIHTN